jgi:hypothetical protein
MDAAHRGEHAVIFLYLRLVGWLDAWIESVASVKTLLELGLLFYALEKEWRTGYVLNLAVATKRDDERAKSHQLCLTREIQTYAGRVAQASLTSDI